MNKSGRNDPCPCGSGKKYKKCCQDKYGSFSPASAELNQLIALFNAGRNADVESRARPLLKKHPDFGVVWKMLGVTLQMQGKDGLLALQRAAVLLPDDADVHFSLGNTLLMLGRLNEAETSYRHTLQIRPDYVEAHGNLGNILRDFGRLDEAESSYRRALQIRPSYAVAHYNLGNLLRELDRLDEAEVCYRRALQIRPDYVEAHSNLGSIIQGMGRLNEAEASYRRALELRPDYAETHYNLGNILRDLERLDEAEASYRRALERRPDYAETHYNLGNILRDLERLDEAEASYRRALKLKPGFAEAHSNLGGILTEQGRFAEAEASLRHALEIKPDLFDARLIMAQVRKVKAGDENLAAMIAAEDAARSSTKPLPDKEMMLLHFALGKSADDIGDHGKAFAHFLEGCKLKHATFDYDPDQSAQYFASIMRNFDTATIGMLHGGGDHSHLPIFILGMPRSGTTLTEQIIASHPEVHGAGELPDLMTIARCDIAGATFPDNVRLLDPARLSAWGAEYVTGLQRRAPDARRITDKMPANFLAVGLIHLMLPNAKIVHVNRNPVDTCLSCFTKLFKNGQQFTYDLAELGRYYADYARLMEHWRKVLPGGAFLDVQYEDIVADQEAQARRLIEYCGLEWDDACLDFHQNKRVVRTASVTQVRQPIYKSSVERWRPYEKFLGPLFDALGDLAPER